MNRIEREDAEAIAAAELEAEMTIAQANRINETFEKIGKAVFYATMAASVIFLIAVFFHITDADAAKRNVYRGTVTICYAPATKAPKIDQYLYTQWDLVAAAKAAGVGSVRVVKERYPHTTCFGDVSVWSSPEPYYNNATRPYYVYTYGEAGQMWYSQVTMGDKVGAKSTAAQRQAYLVAALKVAIPR